MKTAATKSTRSHSTTVSRSGGFFSGTRSSGFFSPVMRKARTPMDVQTKLSVSKPADPLEKQADRTADTVMRMPEQVQRAAGSPAVQPPAVQRAAAPERVQRFGEGMPSVAADAKAQIQHATTGGTALGSDVTAFMQPRLGADLSSVRVHTDEGAASLSNHLSARAFTYRNHVFFGRDQYQPGSSEGRHLLAHELTHTIQQGATVQRKAGQHPPEAQRVADVQRAEVPPQVAVGPTPSVQRLGVDDVLDYFADKSYHIPGFRLLTLIIGVNPINRSRAERTAANYLRALIELIPGGAVITQALDKHGVINKAADWVEQKVSELGAIGGEIVDALDRFIDSLSWSDIFDLGDVWDRAKRIFSDPIDRLLSFARGVVDELLGLVKQAILRPLAELARRTSGYDLLKAILEKDPITDEYYPRNAETLLGGFMKLIGREDVWKNLQAGNAVTKAWAWFQKALRGLVTFVQSIPGRIMAALRSLTFVDVITIAGAFRKVGGAFLDLAKQFGSWALEQVLGLLEILVSAVKPKLVPYITKAKTTFQTIAKDPVGFVGNLVRAGKLGFQRFASRILVHLQNALITWLVGPLAEAGVYIPKSFGLLEIVKLVLSVLGVTWANIRSKLVTIIPEPMLQALEKTAPILVTLVNQGPAAAWEQIAAELTELKDKLIGEVTRMIELEAVKAAVKKLATMLNPAGAVIQAIIAIWNTVSFFIEKIDQIGAVVRSFVDSISAIAAGQVENAAKKVENTMANTLVLVIGFLAKFAGLGAIPAKLVDIVKKIRAPIDKGLDKIVAWLGKMFEKVVSTAKETAKKLFEWWRKKVPITGANESHTLTFQGERNAAKLVVRSDPEKPSIFLRREAEVATPEARLKAEPLIDKTAKSEAEVAEVQSELRDFDNNKEAAVSGAQQTSANKAAVTLDKLLVGLARTIGRALVIFGVKEQPVTDIALPREVITLDKLGKKKTKKMVDWNKGSKAAVAAEHAEMGGDPRLLDAANNIVEDQRSNFARRHVVSLGDIGQHYETSLNGKKPSKAKLLLEQRGSIDGARVPVTSPVDSNAIKKAALKRWRNFFGYAQNIFLGDSKENSSIQEHLDEHHPEMKTANLLEEHVDRIKRGWAFEQTFKPTRLKK